MSAACAWRGFHTAGFADAADGVRAGAGIGADTAAAIGAGIGAEPARAVAGAEAARTPGAAAIRSSMRSGAPVASTPPRRERIV
jgi:hypothetical protein